MKKTYNMEVAVRVVRPLFLRTVTVQDRKKMYIFIKRTMGTYL